MTTGDGETRERLLDAAERLFAARGFRDVTVRDICHAARANVAAVNYHFGDKLALYAEVIRRATAAMREATDEAERAGRGLPPEERLRLSIQTFLQRLLRPRRETLHRVVEREMRDPTPALDAVVEEGVRPRIRHLAAIVAELMEADAEDPEVLGCVGSVHAQSLMFLPNPVAARLGFTFDPTPEHIEEAARAIATFSLGGIRAVAAARASCHTPESAESHAEG